MSEKQIYPAAFSIGKALIALGGKMGLEIPPIQCLVINRATKMPGEGIGWFIDQTKFKKLSNTKKTDN